MCGEWEPREPIHGLPKRCKAWETRTDPKTGKRVLVLPAGTKAEKYWEQYREE